MAKTCYLSIPFGRKPDAQGRVIDFDAVYADLLRPALEGAGLAVARADELASSTVIHRAVFEAILGSDVMVADLTTANPNVMYELGIRHASRRATTILVMADGTRVPFNINLTRVFVYALGYDGRPDPDQAPSFRERLGAVLREALSRATSDSPVFAFFPDLLVELPSALGGGSELRRRAVTTTRSAAQEAASAGADPTEQVRHAEQALHKVGSLNPFDYIAVLKRYRDNSAWDDLIRAADQLPSDAASAPEAIQLLALALNRRGKSGDRARAIELMERLVAETGGDGETYGILGRIYKDKYEECLDRGDKRGADASLDDAIEAYLKGFEIEPSNYYPGVNAVTLLLQRGTDEARARAEALVPRVRQALELRMREGAEGYWELATALELAVAERSWSDAESIVERIAATESSPWMRESTARQLRVFAERSGEASGHIEHLASRLEADLRAEMR